jgi:hypothetical protein
MNIDNEGNRRSRSGGYLRKCDSYITNLVQLLSVTWQSIVPLQLHYLCHIPWNFLPVTSWILRSFIHHYGLLKILQYHQPITLQFRIFGNHQNCISHVLVPSTFSKYSKICTNWVHFVLYIIHTKSALLFPCLGSFRIGLNCYRISKIPVGHCQFHQWLC